MRGLYALANLPAAEPALALTEITIMTKYYEVNLRRQNKLGGDINSCVYCICRMYDFDKKRKKSQIAKKFAYFDFFNHKTPLFFDFMIFSQKKPGFCPRYGNIWNEKIINAIFFAFL